MIWFLVTFLITATLTFVLLGRIAGGWVVRRQGAFLLPKQGRWQTLYKVLERLSRRAQLPCPRIFLIEDYSPNAFAAGGFQGRQSSIVITEGLLQILDGDELEAAFCLCLAQLKLREFRGSPLVAILMMPFSYVVSRLPFGLGCLFESSLAGWMRFWVRPDRMFKADDFAAQILLKPQVLASTLQKMEVVGRKVPLANTDVALDHLFLLPTLRSSLFTNEATHPDPELRIKRLLNSSLTC